MAIHDVFFVSLGPEETQDFSRAEKAKYRTALVLCKKGFHSSAETSFSRLNWSNLVRVL